MVVGGILAPATTAVYPPLDGWDSVELQWLSVTHELRSPFRSTECEGGRGQFKDWDEQRRRALMRDLTSVLVDAPLISVAVVTSVDEFRKLFPEMNEYGPYYLGVQYLIAALANYGESVSPSQDFTFTFEDSDATSGKTRELFNQLKTVCDWPAAKRLSRITFSDKRVLAL